MLTLHKARVPGSISIVVLFVKWLVILTQMTKGPKVSFEWIIHCTLFYKRSEQLDLLNTLYDYISVKGANQKPAGSLWLLLTCDY